MNRYLFAFLVLSASVKVCLSVEPTSPEAEKPDVCIPKAVITSPSSSPKTTRPCYHNEMIINLRCRIIGAKDSFERIDPGIAMKAYLTRIVELETLNANVSELRTNAIVSIILIKFSSIPFLMIFHLQEFMFNATNDLYNIEKKIEQGTKTSDDETIYILEEIEKNLALYLANLAEHFGTSGFSSSFTPTKCLVQGEAAVAFPCGSIGGKDKTGKPYEPNCKIEPKQE